MGVQGLLYSSMPYMPPLHIYHHAQTLSQIEQPLVLDSQMKSHVRHPLMLAYSG